MRYIMIQAEEWTDEMLAFFHEIESSAFIRARDNGAPVIIADIDLPGAFDKFERKSFEEWTR
jgi:hypothetical protein